MALEPFYAGENLEAVLRHHAEGLDAPIRMCDVFAANSVGEAPWMDFS